MLCSGIDLAKEGRINSKAAKKIDLVDLSIIHRFYNLREVHQTLINNDHIYTLSYNFKL